MSHLDTAFKLGAVQAEYDFNAELRKHADMFGGRTPGGVIPEGPAGGSSAVAPGAAGGRTFGTGASARGVANTPPAAPAAAVPKMQLSQPTMGARPGAGGSSAISPGALSMGGMGGMGGMGAGRRG